MPHTTKRAIPDWGPDTRRVLELIVKLHGDPRQRTRVYGMLRRAWEGDPDYVSIFPVVERLWLEAVGMYDGQGNLNPDRDHERIIDFVIRRIEEQLRR